MLHSKKYSSSLYVSDDDVSGGVHCSYHECNSVIKRDLKYNAIKHSKGVNTVIKGAIFMSHGVETHRHTGTD